MDQLGGKPKTGLLHRFLAAFRRVFGRKGRKMDAQTELRDSSPQRLHTPDDFLYDLAAGDCEDVFVSDAPQRCLAGQTMRMFRPVCVHGDIGVEKDGVTHPDILPIVALFAVPFPANP